MASLLRGGGVGVPARVDLQGEVVGVDALGGAALHRLEHLAVEHGHLGVLVVDYVGLIAEVGEVGALAVARLAVPVLDLGPNSMEKI